MTETPVGLPENPADFDILDWIQTGTVATRTVTVYNRPELIDELEQIDADLEAAGWVDDPQPTAEASTVDAPLSAGPGSGADVDVSALLARRTEVEDALLACRAEWTVRALSSTEIDGTYDVLPEPRPPAAPKENAPQALRDAYTEKIYAYTAKKAKADADRKLLLVSLAVQAITTAKGVADHVTVDQLQMLLSRPHGKSVVDMLYKAVSDATSADVDVPRPTSPRQRTSSLG